MYVSLFQGSSSVLLFVGLVFLFGVCFRTFLGGFLVCLFAECMLPIVQLSTKFSRSYVLPFLFETNIIEKSFSTFLFFSLKEAARYVSYIKKHRLIL